MRWRELEGYQTRIVAGAVDGPDEFEVAIMGLSGMNVAVLARRLTEVLKRGVLFRRRSAGGKNKWVEGMADMDSLDGCIGSCGDFQGNSRQQRESVGRWWSIGRWYTGSLAAYIVSGKPRMLSEHLLGSTTSI